MNKSNFFIAVDLGAESGRVMLASVSERLSLEEIFRFPNGPIDDNGSLKWDFQSLLANIKTGLKMAIEKANGNVAGIGVDSWGVDYGLIDSTGELLENPFNYRDPRTEPMMDYAFSVLPKKEIYMKTGIEFMSFNTLYQLLAAKKQNGPAYQKADKLIPFADLVSYHLCGKAFAEYTLASTTQLMDMNTGKWSKDIFDAFDLPLNIMPEILPNGTVVAPLTEQMQAELGCGPIPVITVGSHDTACAIAATPAQQDNWAYLSCGTWSLIGAEIDDAIINDTSFKYQFTNEGGASNTITLLKNLMGLWLVQESKRQWEREGENLDYSQITKLAAEASPFQAIINPNNQDFMTPGDMPAKINKYLVQCGFEPVNDKGQLVRIILESLALNYRYVIEKIEEVTGKPVEVLHIFGGGIQNELLCQITADAINRPVIAGPVEATASGNILIQAMATGQIADLNEARKIVADSFELKHYQPQNSEKWNEYYSQNREIFNA